MIRKLLVSLIVIIFINFVAVAVMLWSFERNYLSADFYNGPAGEKISEIAAEHLSKKIAQENTDVTPQLSEADYYQIIKTLFSKKFIHSAAQSALKQLTDYQDQKSFKISLAELKANIEPATFQIAQALVAEMKECEQEDIKKNQAELNCIPPTIEKEEFVVQLQEQIELNLTASVPDEIEIDKNRQLEKQLTAVSNLLSQKEQIKKTALIIFFLTLMVIALIIFRPWHQIVIWYGRTFALTGIVLLLNGVLLDNLEIFISQMVVQKFNPEIFSDIQFFLQFFIKDLFYVGGLALGMGILLYIAGKLLKPYRVDQPKST